MRGDLRQLTAQQIGGPCDLLTGTPPYLPLGSALPSPDPQRAAARLEVFARADAPGPLLSVWTLGAVAGPLGRARLFTRDAGGARTAAARQLRATFGLQPQA